MHTGWRNGLCDSLFSRETGLPVDQTMRLEGSYARPKKTPKTNKPIKQFSFHQVYYCILKSGGKKSENQTVPPIKPILACS